MPKAARPPLPKPLAAIAGEITIVKEFGLNKIVRRSFSGAIHQLVEVDNSGGFIAHSDLVVGSVDSADKLARLLTEELNSESSEPPATDRQQLKTEIAALATELINVTVANEFTQATINGIAIKMRHIIQNFS